MAATMQCRLRCEKPEDIVYTMTVTATAKEWEMLRDQLRETKFGYPGATLTNQIDDLLGQARKIYWPAEPKEPT